MNGKYRITYLKKKQNSPLTKNVSLWLSKKIEDKLYSIPGNTVVVEFKLK